MGANVFATNFRRKTSAAILSALMLSAPGLPTLAHESDQTGRALAEPRETLKEMAHKKQAHHRQRLETKLYVRSERHYPVPELTLLSMQGENIQLRELMDSDNPVLMQFIFTTCATICPALSISFAVAQDELRAITDQYRMVSISIDPEHDTPAVLRKYATRFRAGHQWHFLTGSKQAIERVQKAFDAYYPANNKMYHQPYTYLRARPGAPWVRLDGMLSTANLVAEFRELMGRDITPR